MFHILLCNNSLHITYIECCIKVLLSMNILFIKLVQLYSSKDRQDLFTRKVMKMLIISGSHFQYINLHITYINHKIFKFYFQEMYTVVKLV